MNYFSQVVSVKQGPQRKKTTVPLYTGKRDELFFTRDVRKTRTATKKTTVPQAIKKSKIFLIKSSCLSISCPLTRKEINTLSLKTKNNKLNKISEIENQNLVRNSKSG